jgi:hypothetical protein
MSVERVSMKRAILKYTRQEFTLAGVFLGMILVIGFPTTTYAAELALLLAVPSLFDGAILIVSAVALVGAIRVYGSVKGGLLAKSWQFFVIALICLVVAQLFQLANIAGYFQAPELLRPVIFTAMAGLFLLGVLKARRALS